MSVIRNDFQVALNDLIVACREAANCHGTAADAVSNDDLATALRDIAQSRSDIADMLAAIVAADDDIPNTPNDEKQALKSAVVRLRSAVSGDEVSALLEECQDADDGVVAAASALLEHEMDEDLRTRIVTLRSDAHAEVNELRRRFPSTSGS